MPRAAKNPTTGLTEKQEAFAMECIRLGSPARAYRKVYEAGKMSQVQVWTEARSLLAVPQIATRVAHFQEVADKTADVTVERIARELCRIAFFDPRELFDEEGRPVPIDELPEDTARVIAGLDVEALFAVEDGAKAKIGQIRKYKIASKLTALEVLAKWKKMLIDRVETGRPGDFARLSDDELDKHIAAERAAVEAAEAINHAKLRAKSTSAKKSVKE